VKADTGRILTRCHGFNMRVPSQARLWGVYKMKLSPGIGVNGNKTKEVRGFNTLVAKSEGRAAKAVMSCIGARLKPITGKKKG